MANEKTTALAAFTPILTDIMFGVDNPGGSPISGQHTYSVMRDLMQANLAKKVTPDQGELTISSGAVTATGSYHTVDTESDASADDLDTINSGTDGMVLVLQAENTARTVNVTRAGNIHTSSDPVALADTESTITLLYSGALSAWVEISKSTNT